jgi:peptide/nickel transport system permease protein
MIILAGILAPMLVPHDPVKVDLSQRLLSPGDAYLLGTDHLGRCIFSRLIYGVRISLGVALTVLTIVLTTGLVLGTVSGYLGGWVDNLFMRVVDILMAFPGIILALAIAGILGPSLPNIMIALAAVNWVGYARITRGMVLSIKEKEYVLAARACGTSDLRIVMRHILPNMLSPMIVFATLDMGAIILKISGLSFLGLGAQPPDPEWGAMLNDGRPYMQVAPWLMFFPGLSILLAVMAFNLLGDGLRDALDPKGGNS